MRVRCDASVFGQKGSAPSWDIAGAGSDAGQGVNAAVAEPVAGALQRENISVVDDAVDHRGGDGLVAEHATPTGERQV